MEGTENLEKGRSTQKRAMTEEARQILSKLGICGFAEMTEEQAESLTTEERGAILDMLIR